MLTKENVISTINNLQDPITLDDILDKILLLDKIEKGLEQSDNGEVISDEVLDKRVQLWLV
ncbi:MAG: hypothetical protein WCR42_15180 [bacterium]